MKKILLLSMPLLMLLFTACSTSKITDSYTTENAAPAKKILVLGMFSDKNRTAKRAMEKELANDLQKFGYDAITATEEFGPTAFRNMTEKEAMQKLQDEGIQSVITITLVNKDKQKRYVPSSYSGYNPGFWGYYSYYSPWAYRSNYRPGYTEVNTSYVFETNLYNVDNNQLIYSAESKTADANSMSSLANDYAKAIVRDMKKKNVLG